jgi:hypothetical protein
MNLFRCGMRDGSLDRKYLRVCAVYRLLRKNIIDKTRALELLAQRHTATEMKTLRRTVALWNVGDPSHASTQRTDA